VDTGTLTAARVKVPTPRPALPDAVSAAVGELVRGFGWTGPAGITFPGVVTGGTIQTAANLEPEWIGVDGAALFAEVTGLTVRVINDADAAGLAEMRFGAGVGETGTVLMLTFGTGIGSALFTAGVLVPNTEFGHIEIRGKDAEKRASEHAREVHDLSWGKWAGRVDEYLHHMEALLSPDLFIIGGGVSRQSAKFLPRITGLRARIVPAAMHNDAGIAGAAMAGGPGAALGSQGRSGAAASPGGPSARGPSGAGVSPGGPSARGPSGAGVSLGGPSADGVPGAAQG
jgi:polyphosphate glucokinase